MSTLYIRITRKEASCSLASWCAATPHDGTFAGIVAAIAKLKAMAGYYDVCSLDIEDV